MYPTCQHLGSFASMPAIIPIIVVVIIIIANVVALDIVVGGTIRTVQKLADQA